MGESWKMHDESIVELGGGWAMLEEGIVTITMLETCNWRHNKPPKALGIAPWSLTKKKKKTLTHLFTWRRRVGHKKLINKVNFLTYM
jgi:hypothetical protein